MFSKISRKTWFPCVSNTKTYESMEIHTMKHSIGSVHSKTHKMLVQHKGLLKSLRLTCKIISHSDCVTGSDFTRPTKAALFHFTFHKSTTSAVREPYHWSNYVLEQTSDRTKNQSSDKSKLWHLSQYFSVWTMGKPRKANKSELSNVPKAQESDKYHKQSYLNDRKFLFAKKPMGLGLSRLLDSSSRNPSEIGCGRRGLITCSIASFGDFSHLASLEKPSWHFCRLL